MHKNSNLIITKPTTYNMTGNLSASGSGNIHVAGNFHLSDNVVSKITLEGNLKLSGEVEGKGGLDVQGSSLTLSLNTNDYQNSFISK